MPDGLVALRQEVIACRRCPRLVEFRERSGAEVGRRTPGRLPWARPVPGFGDPAARLLLVGLAPSVQGANRTGRMFTGDRSAEFLVRALHAVGLASQPTSVARGDGLSYRGAYLSSAVRCVPPGNQPRPAERAACQPYLVREIGLLPELRAILALGGFAWEATLDAAATAYGVPRPGVPFRHGQCAVLLPHRPFLWASFHPSPQNTNTGKLTAPMLETLLRRILGSTERDRGPAQP